MMKSIVNNNKELLEKLYNYTFNKLNRNKVFEMVNQYKITPILINLRLALKVILKWGDYTSVIGRKRNLNETTLVNRLNDEYNEKFLNLFVNRVDVLNAKECYQLFDNELKIDTIGYAYFTKIIYFFTPRDKGFVIFDKWLVINSLKLAAELEHPYAKWYSDVLKNIYQYHKVNEQTYEDYINFMLDVKYEFDLSYADELETLLFGWRKQFNKNFIGYSNPRNVLIVQPTQPVQAAIKSVISESIEFKANNLYGLLTTDEIQLLEQFIAIKPNGTMAFATALGYERETTEWKRVFRKTNAILRKLQNSASSELFFRETILKLV